METEKLGQNGAFPFHVENENGTLYYSEGISKRFYAACSIINGMLANDAETFISGNTKQNVQTVYEIVDELLRQEEES